VCNFLAADSKDSAGAPEDEIEITDEMIDAGELAIITYCAAGEDARAAALVAFKAIWKARRKAPRMVPQNT
jgi:hypothetical protein